MTSDHQDQRHANEHANYETLGDSITIFVGKTGFVDVSHKRAHLPDGSYRDFVLIARGYVTKTGAKRTERILTLPAGIAGRVAAVLAAPERDLARIALELDA